MIKRHVVIVTAVALMMLGSGTVMASPEKTVSRSSSDPCSADCLRGHGTGSEIAVHGMERHCPCLGHRGMPGQLSLENRKAYQDIMRAFIPRMAELRDQLSVKKMELSALSRNPNTTPEIISRVSGEIGQIKAEIRKERQALIGRLESEVGTFPFACSMMSGKGRHGWHGGERKHIPCGCGRAGGI